MTLMSRRYWRDGDFVQLANAQTFNDIAQVVIAVAKRMKFTVDKRRKVPNKVTLLCGPISTGGFDSPENNLIIFQTAINVLTPQGFVILDPRPLHSVIARFRQQWQQENGKGYCWPVLHEVYGPLLQSGHIAQGCFLPRWETSQGSQWKKEKMEALGIKTFSIPEDRVLHIVPESL